MSDDEYGDPTTPLSAENLGRMGSKLPPITPMMGEYELNFRSLIKRWLN